MAHTTWQPHYAVGHRNLPFLQVPHRMQTMQAGTTCWVGVLQRPVAVTIREPVAEAASGRTWTPWGILSFPFFFFHTELLSIQCCDPSNKWFWNEIFDLLVNTLRIAISYLPWFSFLSCFFLMLFNVFMLVV